VQQDLMQLQIDLVKTPVSLGLLIALEGAT
jgi:hypothetical protein